MTKNVKSRLKSSQIISLRPPESTQFLLFFFDPATQSESKLINGVAGKTTGHVISHLKTLTCSSVMKIVEQRPRLFMP